LEKHYYEILVLHWINNPATKANPGFRTLFMKVLNQRPICLKSLYIKVNTGLSGLFLLYRRLPGVPEIMNDKHLLSSAGLAESIARRIEQDLESIAGPHLPSTRMLARNYGISRQTVNKALEILGQKGIVSVIAKKRPLIVSRQLTAGITTVPAEETLYRWIRSQITRGDLIAGKRLPKLDFFKYESGLSHHSIRKILNRLCHEWLVHSLGRKYIAGPPRMHERLKVVPATQGLIFICGDFPWQDLCSEKWHVPFADGFMKECENYGIRLVFIPREEIDSRQRQSRRRKESARSMAARYSESTYLGALVYCASPEPRPHAGIISWLAPLGRPIVIYDFSGRDTVEKYDTPSVVRCRYSDRSNAFSVISYLRSKGHRHIGYIKTGNEEWQQLRLENFREAAHPQPPDSSIITIDTDPQHRPIPDEKHFRRMVENGVAKRIPVISEALRLTQKKTTGRQSVTLATIQEDSFAILSRDCCDFASGKEPRVLTSRVCEGLAAALRLADFFTERAVTAVIAPNDAIALNQVLPWLRSIGLTVPEHISLIAFDNQDRAFLQPLTTVDFGFGALGFQAFHAITGILPVDRTSQGDILATPRILERGSVARAG
jgi:DNA-binding LacI/PurR family transcriptional regulator